MKLFNSENAHWYRRDGEPLHSVPSAGGELRPTTVRDARKLGLLPSVTNVLGVINKPELVEWKMTQAVLAALTLPRASGEELGVFAKRVVEDAQSQVKGAVDFGTAFHSGAEQVAKSLEVDQGGPYAAWLNLFRDWFQANCVRVVRTERVLVSCELRYAGTADLLVEHQAYGLTLVDHKTQSGRLGEAAPPLEAAGLQVVVSAARCLPSGDRETGGVRQPDCEFRRARGAGGTCVERGGIACGARVVRGALVIWRHEKNYDPRVLHRAAGGGPTGTKGGCPLGAAGV